MQKNLIVKKGGFVSYEVVELNNQTYIIEDKAILDHHTGVLQNVEIGDIVMDVYDGVVGSVSHIGTWNFKSTLQFPKNDDLHINRHCNFHCRKVLASTNSSDGANNLKIVGKFKRDVSGCTEPNERLGRNES